MGTTPDTPPPGVDTLDRKPSSMDQLSSQDPPDPNSNSKSSELNFGAEQETPEWRTGDEYEDMEDEEEEEEEDEPDRGARQWVRAKGFESRWGPWGMSSSRSEDDESSRSRSRTPDTEDETEEWMATVERDERAEEEDKYLKPSSVVVLSPTPVNSVAAQDFSAEELLPFRVGAGLRNLGNTCFLNAVLQCLMHTTPLLQGLFMIKHYSPCLSEEFCLVCFMRELVQCAFGSPDAITPYGIVNSLKYFSPDFVRYQQEDAHEFLQGFLDKLEKYPMYYWDQLPVAPNDNLVKQVFGGSLISRLKCCGCNHVSSTPEDLIDFSLEIDEVDTLEGALDSFTKSEKIEDIKLTCDGCKEKVTMEKQFMVDKAPSIASFHLKRFKNDGSTVEKIDKAIGYPVRLNLQPFTVSNPNHSDDLMYDLYAVVVHSGLSSNLGHYYCFVRTSPSTWHEFDDSMVTRVTEFTVLSQEAYILFYAKQGTPWLNEAQSICPPIVSKNSPNSVLDNQNQSGESDSSTDNPCQFHIQDRRPTELSNPTSGPAFYGPQCVKNEALIEDMIHTEYSNSLLEQENNGEKNGLVETIGSDSNNHMLCKEEDNEEKEIDDTDDYNFDLLLNGQHKDEVVVDVNGTVFTLDANGTDKGCEKVEEPKSQVFGISAPAMKECVVYPSRGKTDVKTDKPTAPVGVHPITPPIKQPYGTSITGARDGISEKQILRKRSAEKPVEDLRSKQIMKTLKSTTNMSMSRVGKLLASSKNRTPEKKNKNSQVSPLLKRLSPRSARCKNRPRAAPSSFRSAIR